MSYPVDIKTTRLAATGTIFDGPARVLGFYYVNDQAAGSIVINDDTTAVWIVNTPQTNVSSHLSPVTGKIMLPGTGIRCGTKLKVTNAVVTHVTVYYG